ncbi:hypothetical protein GCM10010971_28280 [Silvimonas amylolytica]|uniref:Uncharacterized protein n=1 Tax=Silvimonas amylolytica TaxID=449663 RepID=A0ABQ2PP43_9NEIS|nr:hypothetical protein GCM10010971_28280 [Silvimonas amylolytica]
MILQAAAHAPSPRLRATKRSQAAPAEIPILVSFPGAPRPVCGDYPILMLSPVVAGYFWFLAGCFLAPGHAASFLEALAGYNNLSIR